MCCNTNTEPLLAQLALLAQLQQGRTPPAPTARAAHWQLALAAQLHRPDWCDHRPRRANGPTSRRPAGVTSGCICKRLPWAM